MSIEPNMPITAMKVIRHHVAERQKLLDLLRRLDAWCPSTAPFQDEIDAVLRPPAHRRLQPPGEAERAARELWAALVLWYNGGGEVPKVDAAILSAMARWKPQFGNEDAWSVLAPAPPEGTPGRTDG